MCSQTPRSCDADPPRAERILVCLCRHAQLLDDDAERRVLDHLRQSGLAFDVVDDLCGLAARGSAELKRIAESPRVRIVACFPRAVRWLFHAAGAPLPDHGAEILNIRAPRRDQIKAFCGSLPAACDGAEARQIEVADDGWVPWFPAIDYDRCEDCRKCLGFCLFGVFALDDGGRVVVKNPANCKLNCPACARVCPEVAIIFPKYSGAPINGAEVTHRDLQREPAQVDVSELAKQDVYAALKHRSAKVRPADQAGPGQSCADQDAKQRLAELQKKLDIPDEVIQSLVGEQKNEPKQLDTHG